MPVCLYEAVEHMLSATYITTLIKYHLYDLKFVAVEKREREREMMMMERKRKPVVANITSLSDIYCMCGVRHCGVCGLVNKEVRGEENAFTSTQVSMDVAHGGGFTWLSKCKWQAFCVVLGGLTAALAHAIVETVTRARCFVIKNGWIELVAAGQPHTIPNTTNIIAPVKSTINVFIMCL